VPSVASPQLAALAAGGIVVGLLLLVRGFGGYRSAARLGGTGTSRIATLAAGEVRVSGVVEPAEVTLVSPLQSRTSVWYRARVTRSRDEGEDVVFQEEHGVGFRVRDESGSIRVFPRGAAMDIPLDYDEKTGMFGEEAIGLVPRRGSTFAPGTVLTEAEREAQTAALLTVRPTRSLPDDVTGGEYGGGLLGGSVSFMGFGGRGGRVHYTEARIEPGDVVTILGIAQPFGELLDPLGADALRSLDPYGGLADPEVAGDLAEARAAGVLVSPEEAWGNAAIPGFGIGRPVTAPELDPGARTPPLATADAAARARETLEIAPDALILAMTDDGPLAISLGGPVAAAARADWQFLTGLFGAVLAIGSAVGLALLLNRPAA